MMKIMSFLGVGDQALSRQSINHITGPNLEIGNVKSRTILRFSFIVNHFVPALSCQSTSMLHDR